MLVKTFFSGLIVGFICFSESTGAKLKDESERGKIVCYYSTWGFSRQEPWSYGVDDIPGDLCTVINYAFFGINDFNWQLTNLNTEHDITKGGLKNFTALRKKYPHLKLFLSVGGWGKAVSKRFSDMVTEESNRKKFISSVVKWLTESELHGLDIKWQYPGNRALKGEPTDKANFAKLLLELRIAFHEHNLLLTCAIPVVRFRLMEGYDVAELSKVVDWFNVLAYDLRGTWDGFTDVPTPLYRRPFDTGDYEILNLRDGLQLLVDLGAPRHKLVVGIPFYGKSYTLENNNNTGLRAAVKKNPEGGGFISGEQGPVTNVPGQLAYFEICSHIESGAWTRKFDNEGKCPFAYHNDQWIAYEDQESIESKIHYITRKGYAGAMVWSMDFDDFNGICGRKNHLLQVIYDNLHEYKPYIKNCQSLSTIYGWPLKLLTFILSLSYIKEFHTLCI